MQTDESKDPKKESGGTFLNCCNQTDFRKMFSGRCSDFFTQGNAGASKEGMMKMMIEMCGGPLAEKTGANTKSTPPLHKKDGK